ncbi:MAG: 3-deoxy-D-manno-octulosonate 8-phosphate phosphatase [Saprospiraceae bacterium]|nr:3-deoxy-D-manno-octulosonate 8-phosphate phosphatase [Saprospiraceae bacterium]
MNFLEKFRKIHTFIFDLDGVLCPGRWWVDGSGEPQRSLLVRDLFALRQAVEAGYRIAVFSEYHLGPIKSQLQHLGIEDLYAAFPEKLDAFRQFSEKYELDPVGILYMGDDLPDYEPMRRVELPACPHDAIPEILQLSQYVSPLGGGEGCVRDVVEKVMRIQRKWPVL